MNFALTRLVFLVSIWSAFLPGSFAQWLTPPLSDPPLPVEVAEQVTVDLVGTLFLFERLFTKSATVTSPDYLRRVSESSSKFYPDYLEYRQGRISRTELVRRLPHIAALGDSLSKNMYISSVSSLFWRKRTEGRKNWFLDTDSSAQSVDSVYEKLDRLTPLVATEYTCSGAKLAPGQTKPNFAQRIGRTRNFSRQVSQVLRNRRFPDLIIIFIGTNNADWVKIVSPSEREHPEKRLQEIARGFGENYAQELGILIDRAKTQDHKVAVVVFGLVDLESFFKARQKADALHISNQKLYRYSERISWMMPSLKPPYQKNMTRVALMMNDEMRSMVTHLNKQLTNYPNVQLEYSDAFSNLDWSLEMLHSMDALHLSRTGHNLFAQAALTALSPSLEFLGINPN